MVSWAINIDGNMAAKQKTIAWRAGRKRCAWWQGSRTTTVGCTFNTMKAMHRCLVLVGLLACGITGAAAQWTVLNAFSSQEIQSHAQTDLSLDAVTASLLTHNVEMRRLSYTMPFLGEEAAVSGAVFVPQAPGTSFPVLEYHHGTTFQRLAAPSFKTDLTNLGYAMASMGFLVLMPDYLGLGESPLQHPYCHAESEADAGWSMVETASALVWDLDVTLNGNLYVTGYSQGGHGAMAMARATPPSALDETLSLKAAAPLSGLRHGGHPASLDFGKPRLQPTGVHLLFAARVEFGVRNLVRPSRTSACTLRHLVGRFAGWRTFEGVHQRHLSGRLDGDVAARGDGDHGRRGLAAAGGRRRQRRACVGPKRAFAHAVLHRGRGGPFGQRHQCLRGHGCVGCAGRGGIQPRGVQPQRLRAFRHRDERALVFVHGIDDRR